MAITIYINFNGNCREAVEFYSKVFGTEKPQIMFYGDMSNNPEFPVTEETKNLVLHTRLNINGSSVMFSDTTPDMPFIAGNNITLVVNSKSMDEIESIFSKLKEGGTVEMELHETFWSKSYGYLIDKFGVGWQLSHDSGQIGM